MEEHHALVVARRSERALRVVEDRVRRIDKDDAALAEFAKGTGEIGNTEVKNRTALIGTAALKQQTCSSHVEKAKIAEARDERWPLTLRTFADGDPFPRTAPVGSFPAEPHGPIEAKYPAPKPPVAPLPPA